MWYTVLQLIQSLGDPCLSTANVIVLVYLYALQNFMDDGPSRGTRRSRRATIKTEKGILKKKILCVSLNNVTIEIKSCPIITVKINILHVSLIHF